jgi:IS30 family transposase
MRNYTRLCANERELIDKWFNEEKLSMRAIADRLGRVPNTISNEINLHKVKLRGSMCKWYDGKKFQILDGGFVYSHEHAKISSAKAAKKSCKPLKLDDNDELYVYVHESFHKGRKPDVIAGRLKKKYPDDLRMRISAETIYLYIYSHLRNGWWEYLEKANKKREKQSKRIGKKRIKGRVSIEHRSKKANNRKEPGHLEGDSIVGKTGGSKEIIQTYLDRKVRKMFVGFSPNKTADATVNNALRIFKDIPKGLLKTITFDNGSEFALHYKIAKELGVQTYFADPYSSWQRGTNERHNRMLRKFFPKGTDFANVTIEELHDAVDFWNNMPRKILGYKTPNEAWLEEVEKILAV